MLRYLDSSALVKLVVAEPETPALLEHLNGGGAITSTLSRVEVTHAVARAGIDRTADLRVEEVFATLDLRTIDDAILAVAAELAPAEMRTLDAIHLATALELKDELDELVAYDRRLLDAAESHGLRAVTP